MSGKYNAVYKGPRPLYTKMSESFKYFQTTGKIEVNKMYTIKVLTHKIRLSDGHVMTDYIRATSENEASEISASLRRCEYDNDQFAIRIRRSPKSMHSHDVKLNADAWGFW